MLKEFEIRRDYLENEQIKTIYIGGGTPSLMHESEIEKILNTIYKYCNISSCEEITIEANPEDWDENKFRAIKKMGFNRISLGVQSFQDDFLKFMNRNHEAKDAIRFIEGLDKIGFENINMDLIYGLPHQNHDLWKEDLKKTFLMPIQHISAYCLTIEPNTVFGKWKKRGRVQFSDDGFEAIQFDMLLEQMSLNGFEQYEISNFCISGRESKHNSSYWTGNKYWGIGPGAHSFNGTSRQWNVSNNHAYIKNVASGSTFFEKEELDNFTKANEYMLTSIRTKYGTDWAKLILMNPEKEAFYSKSIQKLLNQELIELNDKKILLTKQGKLLADKVSEELFLLS
jgi:oxygen-independent coproporphyrinogen-3 oxidase